MGKKRIRTIQADKLTERKAKKINLRLTKGRAYIQSTYNNTIISLTDLKGNVLVWASAGSLGFKGAKKATPYAASLIVKNVIERIKPTGLKEIEVCVKGVGNGRESAIRALAANGMQISLIKDVTPIPHGGCRPRKPRRV